MIMGDKANPNDVTRSFDETDNIQQPPPSLQDLDRCVPLALKEPDTTGVEPQDAPTIKHVDKKETKTNSMVSLLKAFDQKSLKKTKTKVLTVEGVELIEERDSRGKFVVQSVTQPNGVLGYVADTRQDLQVGEVLPGLIIGSQDVAHNLDLLKQYKVTHILNCATLVENLYPYKYKYKNIELYDLPESPILKYFTEAMEFIQEGCKKGCVLVHCNAGVSRSATFVIGYLMKTQGMPYKEAYSYLRSKRPATCPNPGFASQLKKYEEILQRVKQNKKSGKSRTSASC